MVTRWTPNALCGDVQDAVRSTLVQQRQYTVGGRLNGLFFFFYFLVLHNTVFGKFLTHIVVH